MRLGEVVAPLRTSRLIDLSGDGGSHGVHLVKWSGPLMHNST